MSTHLKSRYGACMVSKNIYEKKGNLKWCIKEKSAKEVDNGWRFISDIDTDDYLADNNNWCILSYEAVIEIEPAIISIYHMPIGTDLTLIREGNKLFFVDTNTGSFINLPYE